MLFFSLQGPNHTFSGDGHDKLMDFAKDTFPLAVYGMQDVFSGYLVYLKGCQIQILSLLEDGI